MVVRFLWAGSIDEDAEMNMSSPMSLSSACCGIVLLGGKIPETA